MLMFASGLVLLFIINAVLSDIDIDDDDQGGGGMMVPVTNPA
jgi:hypothetical protein|tara:strand:+ start:240 stop:365 length:126 start_codon:yes stop_codon:yes gene_type:complete